MKNTDPKKTSEALVLSEIEGQPFEGLRGLSCTPDGFLSLGDRHRAFMLKHIDKLNLSPMAKADCEEPVVGCAGRVWVSEDYIWANENDKHPLPLHQNAPAKDAFFLDENVLVVPCGHGLVLTCLLHHESAEVLDFGSLDYEPNHYFIAGCPGDEGEGFLADTYSRQIFQLDEVAVRGPVLPEYPMILPGGVAYDRSMQRLYVSDLSTDEIAVFQRDAGGFHYSFSFGQGEIVSPGKLAVLPNGAVVVLDEAWPGVLKFFYTPGVQF